MRSGMRRTWQVSAAGEFGGQEMLKTPIIFTDKINLKKIELFDSGCPSPQGPLESPRSICICAPCISLGRCPNAGGWEEEGGSDAPPTS